MQAITSLLQDSQIGQMIAQRLLLAKLIKRYLTGDISQHLSVIGFDPPGRLQLAFDSPAWATRFRFLQHQLINQLKKHPDFAELKSFHIRIVQPIRSAGKPTLTTLPKPVSQANAKLLLTTAANIKDPGLANALRRLAKHVQAG
jgi:hypothetical protein